MSSGIWSAASGAVGQTAALDVAANNVANATTPGYRADTSVFRQTLADALGNAAGTRSQRFAITRTTTPDFTPGQVVHTGRALDVALTDNQGLFGVSTSNGDRYTRAGSFRLAVDGTLTTAEGYAVLGENRRPIQLSPDAADIQIAPDGSISADGVESGMKIGVFRFNNPAALDKDGSVLLRARPEAGAPQPHTCALESNALESSNANAISNMTTLVNASRQFEMVTRVIEAFSQIERRAATDLMRR
jgi:flagellar basal body rod protein FlgG